MNGLTAAPAYVRLKSNLRLAGSPFQNYFWVSGSLKIRVEIFLIIDFRNLPGGRKLFLRADRGGRNGKSGNL